MMRSKLTQWQSTRVVTFDQVVAEFSPDNFEICIVVGGNPRPRAKLYDRIGTRAASWRHSSVLKSIYRKIRQWAMEPSFPAAASFPVGSIRR